MKGKAKIPPAILKLVIPIIVWIIELSVAYIAARLHIRIDLISTFVAIYNKYSIHLKADFSSN